MFRPRRLRLFVLALPIATLLFVRAIPEVDVEHRQHAVFQT
jgi:hypothetical protein